MALEEMDETRQMKVLAVKDVRLVTKPWGWERWIADGQPNFGYVLKEIFIRAGQRSSVQFHQVKQETSYVQKGEGILYYSELPVDIERFVQGGYSSQEIKQLVRKLKTMKLTPGAVFHVLPGFIHRVQASKDLLLVESSTVELDDIFRLEDDSRRGHGRIEREHQGTPKEND